MYVAIITLVALFSVVALYLWQGRDIYSWAFSRPEPEAPEDWTYHVVDGPGWFLVTGDFVRE